MKTSALRACVVVLLATHSIALGQEPGFPAPQKEHEWLKQFVGEWESESEATMGPGQSPMKCTGTMTSRMLGGFWVISETTSEMSGTTMHAIQAIGYDPLSKHYVGTWVDSMLNYLWKYQGTVDDSGKVLTLEAEGPNFMVSGKMTKFRDVYEFKTKDRIVATSLMLGDDGKWTPFMTGNLRRKQ